MDLQKNDSDIISLEIKRITQDDIVLLSKWMKFLAVVAIILGALYALTCYGIIIAWYPILLAVWMLQTANKFIEFVNTKAEYSFNEAVRKLKYCVVSLGIFWIIYLILMFLTMIGMVVYMIVIFSVLDKEVFKGLTDMFDSFR